MEWFPGPAARPPCLKLRHFNLQKHTQIRDLTPQKRPQAPARLFHTAPALECPRMTLGGALQGYGDAVGRVGGGCHWIGHWERPSGRPSASPPVVACICCSSSCGGCPIACSCTGRTVLVASWRRCARAAWAGGWVPLAPVHLGMENGVPLWPLACMATCRVAGSSQGRLRGAAASGGAGLCDRRKSAKEGTEQ